MNCSLCHSPFDQNDHLPIRLPCDHIFCLWCLLELYHHTNFECPGEEGGIRCQRPIPIPDGADRGTILRILIGMSIDPAHINIGNDVRPDSARRLVGPNERPAVVGPENGGNDRIPEGPNGRLDPAIIREFVAFLREKEEKRNSAAVVPVPISDDEPNPRASKRDCLMDNFVKCMTCCMPWFTPICFVISVIGNPAYIIVLAYFAANNTESEYFVSSILLMIILAIFEGMIVLFFLAIYNFLNLCQDKMFLLKVICRLLLFYAIVCIAYFIYNIVVFSEDDKDETLYQINNYAFILVIFNYFSIMFLPRIKFPCFDRFLFSDDYQRIK